MATPLGSWNIPCSCSPLPILCRRLPSREKTRIKEDLSSLMMKLLRGSKQKKKGSNTSIPFPQVMREYNLSPSSVSTSIRGLLAGHRTYRQPRDTLTSYGPDMEWCVMLRRWSRSGSCTQILWLPVSAMYTRPMRSVVSWRGELNCPLFYYHFIISDRGAHCLKIYNAKGELIESLGNGYLTLPRGVAIDRNNRMIVVSESSNNFQLYWIIFLSTTFAKSLYSLFDFHYFIFWC